MSKEMIMTDQVKRISAKEFQELGYLQEVNRRFLHPLGLALEVIRDDESGEVSFGGVWDSRDDIEGIIFDPSWSQDKAQYVANEMNLRCEARAKLHVCDEDGIQTRW